MKPIEALTNYINNLSKEYKTGSATEHSYRGYLKDLLETLDVSVLLLVDSSRNLEDLMFQRLLNN